jgi:FkbM family methyltransferase
MGDWSLDVPDEWDPEARVVHNTDGTHSIEHLAETVHSPHGRPMMMAYRRETNDLSAIGATSTLWGFCGNEYLLRDLHDLKGWAIDVGAHVGSVAMALAVDYPDTLRVLAVEALAENCEVMRQSIALNGVENVTVICAAAGDKVAKRVPIAYGWSQAASLDDAYVQNSRFIGGMLSDPSGTFAYPPGVTLTSLLDKYKIERVRFLKIDCEGCEWAFLRSPDIGRVDEIIGEYHFGGKMEGIHELLDATHNVVFLSAEDPVDSPVGLFRAIVR